MTKVDKDRRTETLRRLQLLFALLFFGIATIAESAGSPVTGDDAVKPKLVVQVGHASSVRSVAFSPDGRFALSGGRGDTVRLWAVTSGEEIREFKVTSGDDVLGVAFSPDGKRAAGCTAKMVYLWDIQSGAVILRLPDASFAFAFSPDGRFLASGGPTLDLWDLQTGQKVRQFGKTLQLPLAIAFSPDGRLLLSGSADGSLRLWRVKNGALVKEFTPGPGVIRAVCFSPDGGQVLSVTSRGLRLWHVRTGRETGFKAASSELHSAVFTPDGRAVLAAGFDHAVSLFQIGSRQEVKRLMGHTDEVMSVAVSRDGKFALSGGADTRVKLWNLETGELIREFTGYGSSVAAVAFSPDGRSLLVGSENALATIWSLENGAEKVRLIGHKGPVSSLSFSPDGNQVLTGSVDQTIRLWNAETGAAIRELKGHTDSVAAVAFSPDGRVALSGGADGTARLWNLQSGAEVRRVEVNPVGVQSVAISPDGKTAASGASDWTLKVWDLASGSELASLLAHEGSINSVRFSPDGRSLLTGSQDHRIKLWDLPAKEELCCARFNNVVPVTAAEWSPDAKYLVSGAGNQLILWDALTGVKLRSFTGHSALVNSIAFSPDGRYLASGSADKSAMIWELATGKWLARLYSLDNGAWVVVAPDGRFDTNDLEQARGLHWVMQDDPLHPLPLEIFMRDYYEPRLLPRLLAGEKFEPVKELAALNRVQPQVAIKSVAASGADGFVDVTVEVAAAEGVFTRRGETVKLQSGLRDLRLFRDGQLVGWQDDDLKSGAVVFRNIPLPSRGGEVKFSAYAFNVDRIKSVTAELDYLAPIRSGQGRAYLIAVGVNASENPSLDLGFAVNDATSVRQAWEKGLASLGKYAAISSVSLFSDSRGEGKGRVVTESTATKARFKALLDLLAGRSADRELLKGIAGADSLRKATPDDLVLITFASHGYRDRKGTFYLLPFDVGPGKGRAVTKEMLARSISSDELTSWLRAIDAGDLTLVVDACHAAASVEGAGFKPGPMGSRGLGQLAYDKGMRILAATQADDVAVESDAIGHGLLSYALVHDGLDDGQADYLPKDDRITVAEALAYAARRVPDLYRDLAGIPSDPPARQGRGRSARLVGRKVDDSAVRAQQPTLFDFNRARLDTYLVPSVSGRKLTP